MELTTQSCHPIQGRPTDLELADTQALPDIHVTMTTYVDARTGEPKWLLERFLDHTGAQQEVWSRVTDSLAYVRG